MLEFQDWGLIDYKDAWAKQRELVTEIQANRGRSVLVLCEHPSVITIGKNGTSDNILFNPESLKNFGIDVIYNDRGGDVTLHNQGQLVGYPIFDLTMYKEDLHWFLREIEEAIINVIAEYGIFGGRVDGLTGVWVEQIRKICAMGFHCSRWVTSHGFALNAINNLKEFSYIIPCGITDKEVTSISKETGTTIDIDFLKKVTKEKFNSKFG